jgi:hypothetical protein
MSALAVVFWTLNAVLVAAGVRSAPTYLLTFNLAIGTYAFVDVVCDALMVTEGRHRKRVGAFVNLQWTLLSLASAGGALLGGWMQQQVQAGTIPLSWIFLATGIPSFFTAYVGLCYVREDRVPLASRAPGSAERNLSRSLACLWSRATRWLRGLPFEVAGDRTIPLLALFLFFWKFSPSIGYVERSYLIDVRGFDPASFGTILSAGSITFFVSILVYRWVVRRFERVRWDQYLYAMVGIGVLSFPLSFFLYLDPGHPWWKLVFTLIPKGWNPLPGWNRYEWFRLVFQVVLGFATIPAFMIPLTIAGETVRLARAGVSYAFLMALANATDMFEGAVGAGLYKLLSQPGMAWILQKFRASPLDFAGVDDERTLILQIFVYIGLAFTLLTVPFLYVLQRHLARVGISVDLAGRGAPSG